MKQITHPGPPVTTRVSFRSSGLMGWTVIVFDTTLETYINKRAAHPMYFERNCIVQYQLRGWMDSGERMAGGERRVR
jgi:hypothetical protein